MALKLKISQEEFGALSDYMKQHYKPHGDSYLLDVAADKKIDSQLPAAERLKNFRREQAQVKSK